MLNFHRRLLFVPPKKYQYAHKLHNKEFSKYTRISLHKWHNILVGFLFSSNTISFLIVYSRIDFNVPFSKLTSFVFNLPIEHIRIPHDFVNQNHFRKLLQIQSKWSKHKLKRCMLLISSCAHKIHSHTSIYIA